MKSAWTFAAQRLCKRFSSLEHRHYIAELLLSDALTFFYWRGEQDRITLILDLDETLVHSTIEPPPPGAPACDHTFDVNVDGAVYNVFARKRPYLDYFLREVARLFEVTFSSQPFLKELHKLTSK